MTLLEALNQLRIDEGIDNDATLQMAPELSHDLDIHDAIHVIFGCSTNLRGEILAHLWTLIGTTASFADLHRVMAHQDHKQALAGIGHFYLMRTWLASLPAIVATLFRATTMSHRLPVDQLHSLLPLTLAEIRTRYGIRLPSNASHPSTSKGANLRRLHHRRVVELIP